MENIDTASLVYLLILGAVLSGAFVAHNRLKMRQVLQQAILWVFIFVGAIAAVGLWDDIRDNVVPRQAVFAEQGQISLPRAPDGHYYATLQINDTPIRFVVDTGATSMVLTQADALKAGLGADDLMFLSEASTANGIVRTAPVTLDSVALGPFTEYDFRAFVNEGAMQNSLLGMTYLQRFETVQITGGEMVLQR